MSQGYASAGLPPIDAPWEDYSGSVTFNNFTLDDGSIIVAKFLELTHIVFVIQHVILGAGSSVTGKIEMSLPVTGVAFARNTFPAHYNEAGVDNFPGMLQVVSATHSAYVGLDASTAWLTFAGTSATEPFTWGENDGFSSAFWYEKA